MGQDHGLQRQREDRGQETQTQHLEPATPALHSCVLNAVPSARALEEGLCIFWGHLRTPHSPVL